MQRTSDFGVARFEENEIVLVHLKTKKLYQYLQTTTRGLSLQTKHPLISEAIVIETGLLYPQVQFTLERELIRRSHLTKCQLSSEEQLLNTFLPLFDCLFMLHANGEMHGQIHPGHIVVLESGTIALRDPQFVYKSNPYYQNSDGYATHFDDLRALTLIMLECAVGRKITGNSQGHTKKALGEIYPIYSEDLICVFQILLGSSERCPQQGVIKNLLEKTASRVEVEEMLSRLSIEKPRHKIKASENLQSLQRNALTPRSKKALTGQSQNMKVVQSEEIQFKVHTISKKKPQNCQPNHQFTAKRIVNSQRMDKPTSVKLKEEEFRQRREIQKRPVNLIHRK